MPGGELQKMLMSSHTLETAKEDDMTTVLAWHRVADYDAWERVFDEVVASPRYDVVQSHFVWRAQDDPNLVFVCERFASRDVAEAAYSDPAVAEAMERAGVDLASLQVHYVDEVASGSSSQRLRELSIRH